MDEERKRRNRRKKWKDWLGSWLMILPALCFLLVFTIYPMLNIVRLSFFKGNALKPLKQFVGLDNYRQLFFVKKDFLTALKNTGYYTMMVVVILLTLALLFALWMRADRKINEVSQVLIFTPHLIASISCALIWTWLYTECLWLIQYGTRLVSHPAQNWLSSSSMAMNCVIAVNVWKSIGYNALIILAALKSIPQEIDEAAMLDQAGPFRKFFRIALPMLSPQLFLLLITITTGSFKVFDSMRIMTNGGPGDSTRVLSMYIYDYAFQRNNPLGIASAAGVVLMVILILVTVVYFKCLESRVHYQ